MELDFIEIISLLIIYLYLHLKLLFLQFSRADHDNCEETGQRTTGRALLGGTEQPEQCALVHDVVIYPALPPATARYYQRLGGGQAWQALKAP